MKWKTIFVLLYAMTVAFGIRHRLVVYIVEESFVVVFVVGLGITALLFVLTLFVLFCEGGRRGFHWLVDKSRGACGRARHQVTRPKPLRSNLTA
jgi:ABC-type microcin C transport system permease subunit YejB